MAEWKYEVQLKQHTPMMHFQPGQAGATLRATEVKPKLDRFLLWLRDPKKLRQAKTGAEERVALWQLAGDWALPSVQKKADPALCYKMRICGKQSQRKNYKKASSVIKSSRHRSIIYEKVTLTIICFQKELMEEIKKVLPMFFVIHNFGYRQNKGFGSFEVISFDKRRQDQKVLIQNFIQIVNANIKQPTVQLHNICCDVFGRNILKKWNDLDIFTCFDQRKKAEINNKIK